MIRSYFERRMVNTFLPYESFTESARCLDKARLGKQRVECHQILGVLLDWPTKDGKPRKGWTNHPAVRMWRGHASKLMQYMNCMVQEWIDRGCNNSYKFWTDEEIAAVAANEAQQTLPWLGFERLHSSHRAALLFKDSQWYMQFGWPEQPVRDYYWPA